MARRSLRIPLQVRLILRNSYGSQYDIIAIDEAQFFDDGIVETVITLADDGYRVVIAGLDRDFRGEPFGPMPRLMAVAEHVTKLQAVCTGADLRLVVHDDLLTARQPVTTTRSFLLALRKPMKQDVEYITRFRRSLRSSRTK